MKLNRRNLLQILSLTGLGTFASSQLSRGTASQINSKTRLTAQADAYASQVDAGLNYFKEQTKVQIPLVENLLAAIASGNLDAAKKAYIDSRPPYEQIEVLALNFEQTDTDIDARPYAFDNGEEDEAFKGFHRIEAYIFRDGDLQAALPYAEELVQSIKTLGQDLQQRQNFDSPSHFEGMIGVATEVPAKKISSEEETWSDQSLLIFQENWKGIYSQIEPFMDAIAEADINTAEELKASYQAAMATVAPYFTEGQVAAQPYSSLNPSQRGEIVEVAYRFRDSIIDAKEKLNIA